MSIPSSTNQKDTLITSIPSSRTTQTPGSSLASLVSKPFPLAHRSHPLPLSPLHHHHPLGHIHPGVNHTPPHAHPSPALRQFLPAFRCQSVAALLLIENSPGLAPGWPALRDRCLRPLLRTLEAANGLGATHIIKPFLLETQPDNSISSTSPSRSPSSSPASILSPSSTSFLSSPLQSPSSILKTARRCQSTSQALQDVTFRQHSNETTNKLSVAIVEKAMRVLEACQSEAGEPVLLHLFIVATSAPASADSAVWNVLAQLAAQVKIHCHLILSTMPGEDYTPLTKFFHRTLRLQAFVEEPPSFFVDPATAVVLVSARPSDTAEVDGAQGLLPNITHTRRSSTTSQPDAESPPTSGLPPTPSALHPLPVFSPNGSIADSENGSDSNNNVDHIVADDTGSPQSLVSRLQQAHGLTKKKVYGTKPRRPSFFQDMRVDAGPSSEPPQRLLAPPFSSSPVAAGKTVPQDSVGGPGRAMTWSKADRAKRTGQSSPVDLHVRRHTYAHTHVQGIDTQRPSMWPRRGSASSIGLSPGNAAQMTPPEPLHPGLPGLPTGLEASQNPNAIGVGEYISSPVGPTSPVSPADELLRMSLVAGQHGHPYHVPNHNMQPPDSHFGEPTWLRSAHPSSAVSQTPTHMHPSYLRHPQGHTLESNDGSSPGPSQQRSQHPYHYHHHTLIPTHTAVQSSIDAAPTVPSQPLLQDGSHPHPQSQPHIQPLSHSNHPMHARGNIRAPRAEDLEPFSFGLEYVEQTEALFAKEVLPSYPNFLDIGRQQQEDDKNDHQRHQQRIQDQVSFQHSHQHQRRQNIHPQIPQHMSKEQGHQHSVSYTDNLYLEKMNSAQDGSPPATSYPPSNTGFSGSFYVAHPMGLGISTSPIQLPEDQSGYYLGSAAVSPTRPRQDVLQYAGSTSNGIGELSETDVGPGPDSGDDNLEYGDYSPGGTSSLTGWAG